MNCIGGLENDLCSKVFRYVLKVLYIIKVHNHQVAIM